MSIETKHKQCDEGFVKLQQPTKTKAPTTPTQQTLTPSLPILKAFKNNNNNNNCSNSNVKQKSDIIIVSDNEQIQKQQELLQAKVHVTRKSKQLLKQTPVDSTESNDKGEKQKPQQQQQYQRQGQLLSETKAKSESSVSLDDLYECSNDYRIYQNAKVNDFFKSETTARGAKSISEVCLVNDHFILVKMPSSEDIHKEPPCPASPKELQRNNRKLCHYLKYKRNRVRRIAPITEVPEEDDEVTQVGSDKPVTPKSSYCLNVNSCWHSRGRKGEVEEDIEVYNTKTKIFMQPSTSRGVVDSNNGKELENTTKNLDNIKIPEIQSISGSSIQSSQQDRVLLRNQVALIVSDKNNCDNIDFCRNSNSPQERRKCPRFENFYWLLRPFRGKYRKAKPKIQAVVYKTYFVKWTKPPEVRNLGYGGVKSSHYTDMEASVIRRCRSAIF